MNRTQLESALRDLSQSYGYTYYLLPADRIAEVRKFPAAVLEPLTVARVDGRGHGRISYNVNLHVLSLEAMGSAQKQSKIMGAMEHDLLGIFADLSETEQVIAVEELGITPAEGAHTIHGEISQNARAKVVTYF